MDLHVVLDGSRPLRAQLEGQLRDGVRAGRLRAGSRLPPTRILATELGISRGVVVEAYSQLVAEGYLVARRGEGTRVAVGVAAHGPAAGNGAPARPRVRYDLRSGIPDVGLFPRRTWNSAMGAVLRELPDAGLLYGPPHGLHDLRQALAEYLGRVRAVVVDAEQVLITCGSSHAMGLLWHTLRDRGIRRVAIEDPCWTRIPDSLRRAGLDPVPVAVDRIGLRVSDLEAAGADAVVVSPAHQYPTGAVMSPARRAELLHWASTTGGLVIEDDYDAEYRYDGDPLAPLQSLAPDRVAYLGTVSKTLAPGLRLGWLIVPDRLTDDLAAQHAVNHALPDVITQATYADLLRRGAIDRHLRSTRRVYRARREALVQGLRDLLPDVHIEGGSAGLHFTVGLAPNADERGIAAAAGRRGVAIDALHDECSALLPSPPALVLGYGLIAQSAIPLALRELAAAVRS
jgi:GntR family transcriptional regulator/MocR family aminotransferase